MNIFSVYDAYLYCMQHKQKSCPFCDIILKSSGTSHVYGCKSNHSVSGKYNIRLYYIKHNFPGISDEDMLRFEYEECLSSLPEINKKYSIDYKSITFLLDHYGIKRRTISESAHLISKHKYKNTCLERYGAKNALSRGTHVYNKRNETVKSRYNVDNVFQLDFVKSKIANDSVYIEKYGLTRKQLISKRGKEVWEKLSDAEKSNWLSVSIHSNKSIKRSGYTISKNEYILRDILNILNVKYKQQYVLKRKKSSWYSYDFKLINYKILLELNGDYWHANPSLYLGTDIIQYPGHTRTAQDVWNSDYKKFKFAKQRNYDVMYMWVSEIDSYYDYSVFNIEKFTEYFVSKLESSINGKSCFYNENI